MFSRVGADQSTIFSILNQKPPELPKYFDDSGELDFDNINVNTSLDAYKAKGLKYIEQKMAPIHKSIEKQRAQ